MQAHGFDAWDRINSRIKNVAHAGQVRHLRGQPLIALRGVGRCRSRDAHDCGVVVQRCQPLHDARPQIGIRDDHLTDAHPCKVEGFGGRKKSDRAVPEFRGCDVHRDMGRALILQITMHLIRYKDQIVLFRKSGHAAQFLPAPDPARGVLRRTEQQDAGIRGQSLCGGFKIQFVAAFGQHHGQFHRGAAGPLCFETELVIDRREVGHALAGL